MALPGIETARNSLTAASNSYAEIQKQLDRYNKIFEVYANANPETQVRAASVMRQALNEYMGLKRQQEENTLKIYEAQNWVNYYNDNPQFVQAPVQNQLAQNVVLSEGMPEVQTAASEEVPIITTQTPGKLNNNTNATLVEANPIDTNTTMNLPGNEVFNSLNEQNKIKPTTPVGVTNIINSQTPKYDGTVIKPVQINFNSGTNYGPGTANNIGNQTNKTLLVGGVGKFQYSPTLRKRVRR